MKSGPPRVTSEERTNQIQKTIIKKVNSMYVRRLFCFSRQFNWWAGQTYMYLFSAREEPKCAVTSRKRPLIVSTWLVHL